MADRDGIVAALRLAAIVDSSDDAIIGKDLTGTVSSWNRGAERIFGYSAAEAIRQPILLIVPHGREGEEEEVQRKICAGESIEHFETIRRRKDGTLVPVSLTISPVRAHDGTIVGASTIARDITERRRNEALAADLQRRLLTLIDASGSVLGSPRLDTVLPATVNLANELLSADGYAIWRADRDGKAWAIVASRGISSDFADHLIDSAARPPAFPLTEPIVLEDVYASELEWRWAVYRAEGIESMLVIPMTIAGTTSGTLVAYHHTKRRFSDVEVQTARALANLAGSAITTAELYEEQRRSREAVERVNRRAAFLAEASAILGGSLDYEVTLKAVANLAVPHVADWCAVDIIDDAGELKRLAVAHVDPTKVEYARTLRGRYPEDPESPYGVHHVIRTGRSVMMESIPDEIVEARARDPEHLRILRELGPTSYVCVPLVARARTLGALTFVSAESGRQYGTDDLHFAEDVAYRAALAVDNAYAYRQLSVANRAKDEFLATLSHELRTPLNAVLGWARMLRDGDVRGERRAHALEVIERNAEAQLRLVEDLLDVSRIITGKLRLDVQRIELPPIIEAAIEAIQPAATAKNIHVQTALDPKAGPMYGDAARLQQAVWNLLVNAVKFTPRDGRVRVTLMRSTSHLAIEVADTGEGLAPDVLPFVFDRFRQGESGPTRGHGGLGLGLAIVRHIIELHGGSVSASSPGPGQGATFHIHLPVMVASRETRRLGSDVGERTSGPPPSLRGVRVLVVEDDDDARELIVSMLSACDADVAAVSTAGAALAALDERMPDVILSDIEMPAMDGYEFIREVRGRTRAGGGRVGAIALTAYARPEDRARSLMAGFQMHLSKPVNVSELAAAVASVGRHDGSQQPS